MIDFDSYVPNQRGRLCTFSISDNIFFLDRRVFSMARF